MMSPSCSMPQSGLSIALHTRWSTRLAGGALNCRDGNKWLFCWNFILRLAVQLGCGDGFNYTMSFNKDSNYTGTPDVRGRAFEEANRFENNTLVQSRTRGRMIICQRSKGLAF